MYYPYGAQTSANIHMSSYNNRYVCWFQDGRIYSDSADGPRPVGVPLDAYQNLEATATEYKNRLIELGEIEVPLTQEQLNDNIMKELKEERAMRKKLMDVIENLSTTSQHIVNKKEELLNGHEEPVCGSTDGSPADDAVSPIGQ